MYRILNTKLLYTNAFYTQNEKSNRIDGFNTIFHTLVYSLLWLTFFGPPCILQVFYRFIFTVHMTRNKTSHVAPKGIM